MTRDGSSTEPFDASYITLQHAARLYRVSERTIRRRIADGSLRAYRVGRLIRVSADDVGALAEPIQVDLEASG